jgi:dTDP-4-dehydrorhamnose reductase
MKSLVIGASGCVGGILYQDFRKLGETQGTYCEHPAEELVQLDITNGASVGRTLDQFEPDLILQPAAQPNVDWCEDHPVESYRINVEGTSNVVTAARVSGAKYVFFSSDYVFDGKAGPYREDDIPHPIQVYGQHKLDAERVIQEQLTNYLILRVHGVFGWERQGKNFVARLVQLLSQGKTMTVPSDQIGSPTYAPNLSEALRELVQKDCRGIYHLVGSTVIDRYSFARLAADAFGLDAKLLIPKTTEELNQKAPRPLRGGLRIDKAQCALSSRLWSAEESLRHMVDSRPSP